MNAPIMHKIPGKQLKYLSIRLLSLVSTMSVNWFNSFLTAIMKEYVSHVTHRLVK